MNYEYMAGHLYPRTNGFESGTREEFIEKLASLRETDITAETLNESIREAEADIPPFRTLSAEETEKRKEISDKAFFAMAEAVADTNFTEHPATGRRYPERLMMKKDDPEYNRHIADIFQNSKGNEAELYRLHAETLKKLDTMDVDGLLLQPHTDEELADHVGDILFLCNVMLQFQNFHEFLNNLEIPAGDAECRKNADEINRLREKYEPYSNICLGLERRVEIIANPLYSVLDTDAPGFTKAIRDIVSNDLEPEEEILPEAKEGIFGFFADKVTSMHDLYADAELTLAENVLKTRGVKEENLVYKINGREDELPYKHSDVLKILGPDPLAEVTVYDKTKPQISMEVKGDGACGLQKSYIGVSRDLSTPPIPPAEAEDPGRAPSKPWAITRWLYNATNGFLFGTRVPRWDEYVQKKEAFDTFKREQAEYTRDTLLYGTAKRNFLDRHPDYENAAPGMTFSGRDMEEMKKNLSGNFTKQIREDIYGAERKLRGDFIDRQVYSREKGDEIAKNTINISAVKPAGQSVEKEEFSSLAMTVSLAKPFAEKRNGAPASATFEDVLDPSHGLYPRENLGSFVKDIIDPAREHIAMCLSHFDEPISGNSTGVTGKEQLSETLADALNEASKHLTDLPFSDMASVTLTESVKNTLDFADKTGMTASLAGHGMKENLPETVRVASAAAKIVSDGKTALYDLAREEKGEVTFTAEERFDKINKIALSETLKAETERYRSSYTPKGPEYPEKKPGESKEDYNKRMDAFLAESQKFAQGNMGPETFSPVVADLVGGVGQLETLSDALFAKEERLALAGKGAHEICSLFAPKKDFITARLKNLPDLLESLPDPNKTAGSPEKKASVIDPEGADKLIGKLKDMNEGEPLPDHLEENVRLFHEKAMKSEKHLTEECRTQPMVKAGEDAGNLVAYASLKDTIEKNEPDSPALGFYSMEACHEISINFAACEPDVSYLAENAHKPEVIENNLLKEDGLAKIAEKHEKIIGNIASEAEKLASAEQPQKAPEAEASRQRSASVPHQSPLERNSKLFRNASPEAKVRMLNEIRRRHNMPPLPSGTDKKPEPPKIGIPQLNMK